MSAHAGKKSGAESPLVRLRQMLVVVAGIVAILAGPLLLVWKQAYIRSSSVRLEAMTDTLSALDKEIALLRIKSERLSSIERIENFARVSLGLEYTPSDRMVIVSMDGRNNRRSRGSGNAELFASSQTVNASHDHLPKGGRR